MSRYDTGTDDERVRVRARKGSRPRTKRRPDYSKAELGRVVGIDRGRYVVSLEADGRLLTAVKAREIPKSAVVIGDFVRLTSDLSGDPGSLARIAFVEPRTNALRRSLEEAAEGRGEKTIVANADLMVIVVAAADPPPRVGMVDRCLVAAAEAEIPAVLCVTKTDLQDPEDFLANFKGFDLETVLTSTQDGHTSGLEDLEALVDGRFSVLVGHSGVGKSTLINALVSGADRAVGEVNAHTGKGRHTSTSAVALPIEDGGWVVDTPGVRSFGLQHAGEEHALKAIPGVAQATKACLPNCSHAQDEVDCALEQWVAEDLSPGPGSRADRMERLRVLLEAVSN